MSFQKLFHFFRTVRRRHRLQAVEKHLARNVATPWSIRRYPSSGIGLGVAKGLLPDFDELPVLTAEVATVRTEGRAAERKICSRSTPLEAVTPLTKAHRLELVKARRRIDQ